MHIYFKSFLQYQLYCMSRKNCPEEFDAVIILYVKAMLCAIETIIIYAVRQDTQSFFFMIEFIHHIC